jgi:hypothetical protein
LQLASLAALTGRAGLAAAYMRQTAVRAGLELPAPIAQSAPALLAFAALGGPRDSLRVLEAEVTTGIERRVPLDERLAARLTWLARAASLAFPHYRFATLDQMSQDELVDAQAAFARGDTVPARRMFARLRRVRAATPPEDVTLDALYPETALLAAMEDTAGAIAWLDPTLAAVSAIASQMFDDLTRAAALVRAMELRSQLAEGVGDTATARSWGRAVDVLRSDTPPLARAGSRGTQ